MPAEHWHRIIAMSDGYGAKFRIASRLKGLRRDKTGAAVMETFYGRTVMSIPRGSSVRLRSRVVPKWNTA